MFKKLAIAAPMAFLAMASTGAFAAGEASHSIQLTAHVPTNSFHVLPVNADVVTAPQVLVYNIANSNFTPLVESFDVKHTAGSISASIDEPNAYLFNGNTKINLNVVFNDVKLSATPILVVSAADALPGTRVDLEITPVAAPATGYVPGDYTGTVAMTFDAVVTP
ncbi:hypothetical protein BFW87_25385 [Pseudomonas fluorescens]|uniref:Adhesin n=1 Tax=Pseudomonas fluorescens TaxID=294 RepID=A0A1T2Y203_PSEFL|nr:CS1 type fimbrial major subunit [Pseudomonas fluorescens]OPA86089.1 hypothetical protein BFW87_25385 [Pseudomonas fluorescens]